MTTDTGGLIIMEFEFSVDIKLGLSILPQRFRSPKELKTKAITELHKWEKYKDSVFTGNSRVDNDSHPLIIRQISFYEELVNLIEGLNSNLNQNAWDQNVTKIRQLCERTIILEFNTNLSNYLLNQEAEEKFRRFLIGRNQFRKQELMEWQRNGDPILQKISSDALIASFYDEFPNIKKYNPIREIENNIHIISKDFEKKVTEWDRTAKNTIGEFEKNSQAELTSLSERYIESIDKHNDDSDLFLKNKKEKFEAYEKALKEYMKLSEPAKNWKSLNFWYLIKGGIWTILSFVVTFIILRISLYLFNNFDGSQFNGEAVLEFAGEIYTFNPILFLKFFILLALVYSSLIYLLRIFVKLMLSSFHMARDAKERFVLTQVYLALINEENGVKEELAAIVYSSLFSRADTGLLKGDSSPAIISPISAITGLSHGPSNNG